MHYENDEFVYIDGNEWSLSQLSYYRTFDYNSLK